MLFQRKWFNRRILFTMFFDIHYLNLAKSLNKIQENLLDIIHLEPFPLILNLDIIRALHPIILLANRWKIMSYRYHVTSPGDTYHTRSTVPHPKKTNKFNVGRENAPRT